jgi:hypothetical protein
VGYPGLKLRSLRRPPAGAGASLSAGVVALVIQGDGSGDAAATSTSNTVNVVDFDTVNNTLIERFFGHTNGSVAGRVYGTPAISRSGKIIAVSGNTNANVINQYERGAGGSYTASASETGGTTLTNSPTTITYDAAGTDGEPLNVFGLRRNAGSGVVRYYRRTNTSSAWTSFSAGTTGTVVPIGAYLADTADRFLAVNAASTQLAQILRKSDLGLVVNIGSPSGTPNGGAANADATRFVFGLTASPWVSGRDLTPPTTLTTSNPPTTGFPVNPAAAPWDVAISPDGSMCGAVGAGRVWLWGRVGGTWERHSTTLIDASAVDGSLAFVANASTAPTHVVVCTGGGSGIAKQVRAYEIRSTSISQVASLTVGQIPRRMRASYVTPPAPLGGTRAWVPERDLRANVALWLDASDAATISLSGSNVTQWSDKSGFQRHASQATGANQPTYVASNSVGKTCIRFAGGAAFLQTPDDIPLTRTSVFVVQRKASGSGSVNQAVYSDGRCSSANAQDSIQLGETNLGDGSYTPRFSRSGPAVATTSPGAWAENVDSILYAGNLASTVVAGINATTSSAAASGIPNNGPLPVRVGAGFVTTSAASAVGVPYFGDIYEILVATSDLTADEVDRIHGYLAHKWGIASSLPVAHPFRSSPPTVAT